MNMESDCTGVIYCATRSCHYFKKRSSYALYADRSAGSLRQFLPNIKITLFTDEVPHPTLQNFDDVSVLRNLGEGPFFGKITAIKNSPYKNTLFLDCDTMVLTNSIKQLFSLIEKFDIVGCHAPARVQNAVHKKYEHIPRSFPEINTGVMAYKKNLKTDNVFNFWLDCYKEDVQHKSAGNDQAAFRKAIWTHAIDLGIVPMEYNHRNRQAIKGHKISALNTVIHHCRVAYPEITLDI